VRVSKRRASEEAGAIFGVEFGQRGEAFGEAVIVDAQQPAGVVVKERQSRLTSRAWARPATAFRHAKLLHAPRCDVV